MLTPRSQQALQDFCQDQQCYEEERNPKALQRCRSRRSRRKTPGKHKRPQHGFAARRIKRPAW